MFCIKCGKDAAAGNFCKDCFLERESLFNLDNFRLVLCDACGSFYENLDKTDIGTAIKRHIVTAHAIKNIRISYKKRGNRIIASVECSGAVGHYTKTEKKAVEIIFATRKCDGCTKLAGNYYEAVIQIRGDIKDKVLDIIKNSKALFYVKGVDNGYDVRFVRKQDASKLADALKRYEIKRTFKLVGEKDGKKLCRTCYSVRPEIGGRRS